jgi:hypothetical protein
MGSVVFGVIGLAALVLIVVGFGPLWALVPVLAIALGLLLLGPLLGRLRHSVIVQPDSGPQGVPTTHDASYEPVRDPAERT